jgi:hypothetical protein
MDSTAKPAPAGAEDLLLAHGDTRPNGDYERIVREELARVQERLSQLAPVGMLSAAPPPDVKIASDAFSANASNANGLDANITAFRAADVNGVEGGDVRPSRRRGVARVLTGLMVAGVIVGAGAAWAAYGEDVKPLIASWTPQIGATWSLVSEKLGLNGEQAAAPTQSALPTQSATAETSAQQIVPAQASASPAAAAAPAPAADVEQMLQNMARDIASLQQGIDQLKAGQEQMARDNARLGEQLKANQEQLSRVMARASEASMHPRPPLPASPKPPPLAAAHRPPPPPVSTLPPPQAIAPPPQAVASSPADDAALPNAPRPPKPVP